MKEAGITDAESQRGKDFCIDKCPYDHCVVMEPILSTKGRIRIERIIQAKTMRKDGMKIKEISEELGVSAEAIRHYLSK
ncbi:hypothetical protein LCGC14_3023730 [marine sediment metagenome]|uniref:Uncharacterized protein n=1 Tax=marine sediment metagenome TaxID=412755 RepID=A0A0F8XHL7_9ZZZZ